MPKKLNIRLPKLSVTGSNKTVIGTCQACGSRASLSWEERDLGGICRDCAKTLLDAELMQIFEKAKWSDLNPPKS